MAEAPKQSASDTLILTKDERVILFSALTVFNNSIERSKTKMKAEGRDMLAEQMAIEQKTIEELRRKLDRYLP